MIDVVIPARNEALTIGDVVKRFNRHPKIRRVIVTIDPDTTDPTASVARANGAVICVGQNGKGENVKCALRWVRTERVIFCDADVLGLTYAHVSVLARRSPGMVIGVPEVPRNYPREREWAWPFVSGQRSVPVHVARALDLHGYLMETQLNQACEFLGMDVRMMRLPGLVAPYKMTPQRIRERDRDTRWGIQHGVLKPRETRENVPARN